MDTRTAIWNTLHDGEITVASKDGPDLVVFVSIPYLRKRFRPLGDSFSLRLRGFRSMHLLDQDGKVKCSDIEEDLSGNGIEILSTESETVPVRIATTQGFLVLDFQEIEIRLDSGESVQYEEILKACEEYWDDWEKRIKKE